MADGVTDAILENTFFDYNSTAACPICAKFCKKTQNPVECQNFEFWTFKMADGFAPKLYGRRC